jgi:hypothetical protein
MPYLSAVPATIILIVLVHYIVGRYFNRLRPKWANPFIVELIEETHELPSEDVQGDLGWTITLFILSVAGFIAELIQLVPPIFELSSIILLASWVNILLYLASIG